MAEANGTSDRFGVSEQRILDAVKSHSGVVRDGCYVPTRQEVASWPPERLWWHLLGWWWESPSELIPTDAQVAAVVEELRSRRDAETAAIQDLIAQAPSAQDTLKRT